MTGPKGAQRNPSVVNAVIVEAADDEEVTFYERKAQSVLDGQVEGLGPWMEHWSAVEVMQLIKRIRFLEEHKCGGNY